jgi:hypothetical protein
MLSQTDSNRLRKLKFIDQIIHSQHTYQDQSQLVLQLRVSLEKLPLAALSQLATIVAMAVNEAEKVDH